MRTIKFSTPLQDKKYFDNVKRLLDSKKSLVPANADFCGIDWVKFVEDAFPKGVLIIYTCIKLYL